MNTITFKLSDYRKFGHHITWYISLNRHKEPLGEQLAQVSSIAGDVPLLPLAGVWKELYPSTEIDRLITRLSEFYNANLVE